LAEENVKLNQFREFILTRETSEFEEVKAYHSGIGSGVDSPSAFSVYQLELRIPRKGSGASRKE